MNGFMEGIKEQSDKRMEFMREMAEEMWDRWERRQKLSDDKVVTHKE